MAKELTDDELNLRRKARRRLIGAIALTLAVVVILPMVLESQPKPSGQDIELRIPAPDKVGEFVSGAVVSEVAVAPVLAASEVAAPTPVAEPVVEPVPVAQEARVEAAKVQPVVEKAPEPKVTVGKSAAAQSATASAKSADKPASKAGYVAQVGAFSSAATAKQEVDKLKKWGFSKAYTEKIGDKTRVRVGPYEDRDKADKARQLIEKHGMHPVVVGIK
ncbi:MAG TPA: SPOR domain-containing protein [Gallionella sp.]|nr:SPOR domain-containing protein [Gallionella sp.]